MSNGVCTTKSMRNIGSFDETYKTTNYDIKLGSCFFIHKTESRWIYRSGQGIKGSVPNESGLAFKFYIPINPERFCIKIFKSS